MNVVRRELLVVAGFALLAAVQCGITSGLGDRLFVGPDPMQDVWVLHWTTSHLHRPQELFEANNYFPSRYALLYCDPLLGPSVLAAPFRLLTRNPILLYNLSVLTAFTLTGYASYRLALSLWGSVVPAVLAGVLVAHAPPLLAHRAHLNLISIGGLPLVLLGLLRLLDRPRLWLALLTGVVLGLQAATSGYYALIGALLAMIVCIARWRSLQDRRVAAAVAVVAVVAGLLVLPYVQGFLHLSRYETSTAREVTEARHYSVDLPASFLRTKATVWMPLLGSVYEEPMWPGLTLLIFGALGLRRPDDRVRLLLGLAIVFFVLSLGPELTTWGARSVPLPFALLHKLPVFSAVKHPSSFMIPVWLIGGVLAARGLAGWTPRAAPRLWPALVVVAALAETIQPAPARISRALEAPPAYALLASAGPGAVLELPCDINTDSDWQWASIVHGRPIVNGRGAFCPDTYNRLHRLIRTEWNTQPTRPLTETPSFGFFLARFPIRYVIVHPNTPGRIARNVEATPDHFQPLGVAADGARVYRLHNGGRGAELRRWLRADQLAGPIRAAVQGTAGARLRLTIHAHDEGRARVLDEKPLSGGADRFEWQVPPALVDGAMNNLQLSVDRDALVLESFDWSD